MYCILFFRLPNRIKSPYTDYKTKHVFLTQPKYDYTLLHTLH